MSGIVNKTGAVSGIVGTTSLEAVTPTGTQTLTNKTLTTPAGIVKGDVGLGNVDNTADASQVAVGALNAGSLTSGFGTIDTGSSTITTTGALAAATVDTGQGAEECYAMNQDMTTSDAPRFASLNQYETTSSVGLAQSAWGSLWNVSGWGKGLYYYETSQGESYPWTFGWIIKGQLGFTKQVRVHLGTYTNHRQNGNSFEVYHGVSWGGSMNFTGRWRKVLQLT